VLLRALFEDVMVDRVRQRRQSRVLMFKLGIEVSRKPDTIWHGLYTAIYLNSSNKAYIRRIDRHLHFRVFFVVRENVYRRTFPGARI
jgi:hypothetical protein